ncbi:MAG: NUDIX domain-containing protein [Chitinophagaceae bacterium]
MATKICVGGFISRENKFLFGKRSPEKDWAAGLWDIPGGKALKNENPLFTLRREVKEETGLRVRDAELLTIMNITANKNVIFTYHIYMITSYKGKAENLSHEHTVLRWFIREELNSISLALPQYLTLLDNWIITSK